MKILIICNKSPYPPSEGGPIAMNMMVEGLLEAGHQIKILAINTNKFFTPIESIPEDYRIKTGIELHYTDLSLNPFKALYCLLTNQSFHAYRFNNKSWLDPLQNILNTDDFDIVQIETLFMAHAVPFIREKSNAKIILRAHNVEHLIWKRVWETTSNHLKKWYMNHVWKTLQDYENKMLPLFDGIIAITEKDADIFRSKNLKIPVISISFGIPSEQILNEITQQTDKPVVFHIGSMDWIPNREGIQWFVENVWPLVIEKRPDAILRLAGRNMPRQLLKLKAPGVEVPGEVADARQFILQGNVMVVPLFSGSGIRIKIIEAMALGKAIVTTSIGAEGIDYQNNENLVVANEAPAMAAAIVQLLNDANYRRFLGIKAIFLAHRNHNRQKLMFKLLEYYRQIAGPMA